MARTTLNIADPVLKQLRRLQEKERRPLGELVSELLARALTTQSRPPPGQTFDWKTYQMGPPSVDLEDKDAVWDALDERRPRGRGD